MIGIGPTVELPPAVILLIALAVGYSTYLYARIARKAGFSAWWALAMQVPVVNLALIWAFAFAAWPGVGRGLAARGRAPGIS